MDVVLQLLSTLATEGGTPNYQAAEKEFKALSESQPTDVLLCLLNILGTDVADGDQKQDQVAKLAGVFLRQQLESANRNRLMDNKKAEVCEKLLQIFERTTNKICRKAAADGIVEAAQWIGTEWPDLLPAIGRMITTGEQSDPSQKEKRVQSLKLLSDLIDLKIEFITNWLQQNKNDTAGLVKLALTDTDLKVLTQGVIFVLSMVNQWEKKHWAPLERTLPNMLEIVEQLARQKDHEGLVQIFTEFNDTAMMQPLFFKSEFKRVIAMMVELCAAKTNVDDDARHLAHEFIVAMAEQKPKMCVKQCPNFAHLALKACFDLMCEVEDDPEWQEKMDDEEGDEDDNSLNVGLQGVDRLVESLTAEATQKVLTDLIRDYVTKEDWINKFAALEAIRQSIEYLDDDQTIDEMAILLGRHTEHPHMRVRYAAWQALSQMATDQQPQFQERWHEQLMKILGQSIDDPVNRVQQIALSFFVAFGEALDNTNMELYAKPMMAKLVEKVQNQRHRGVREEAVTSIAVIAGVIEKDFSAYYEHIMPILRQLFEQCTSEKESRLRGKAFECISLLGIAVGKERFNQDGQQAVIAMINIAKNLAPDDILAEYIHEALIRICRCLKKEFAPLLLHVLPRVYEVLQLKKLNATDDIGGDDDDDETEHLQHLGKSIKVKTKQFEEMVYVSKELFSYIEELEECFFPQVTFAAETLLPFLSNPGAKSIYYAAEDTREMAFQCWAQLIGSCMKTNTQESLAVAEKLVSEICKGVYEFFKEYTNTESIKSDDLDELKLNANGLASCLKAAEGKILKGDDVRKMFELPMQLLAHNFRLRKENLKQIEDELDEDDEDKETDEKEAQIQLADLLGALMLSSPEVFENVAMEEMGTLMQSLFDNKDPKTKEEDLQLALNIACDLIEHLKSRSVKAWFLFMPKIMSGLHHQSSDIRRVAAYGVSLAATLTEFAEHAQTAYDKIRIVVSDQKKFHKKHDDSTREAMDNMVAAMIQLAVHQNVPNEAWQYIFKKLPLRDDLGEAEKVHAELLKYVRAQNPRVLGPNQENLGKLVGVFSEVYNSEGSNDELNRDIRTVFAQIPKETFNNLEQEFSQKQVKKIQRVLKELD